MVKRTSLTPLVERLLAGLLGTCFLYAALNKIADPQAFVGAIERYQLVNHPLALVLVLFHPWLELTCGLALLLRRCERGALGILLVLCLVFSVAIGLAWIRGLKIDCGCFGTGEASPLALPLALLRALVLAALATVLLMRGGVARPDTRA